VHLVWPPGRAGHERYSGTFAQDDARPRRLGRQLGAVKTLTALVEVLARSVQLNLREGRDERQRVDLTVRMVEGDADLFAFVFEDIDVADLSPRAELAVTGTNSTLANAISETLPNFKLLPSPDSQVMSWSEVVNQKTELWPTEYLMPDGAYIH